jgi:AcrR family transcriptional regulator
VPRLWTDTIEAHRNAVRTATLDAAAALVAEKGLTSVTMSRIAEQTGIGRATLYKYFPDVEAILIAWHERQVGRHLEYLAQVAGQTTGARARLEAVLGAYALILHDHKGNELGAYLHQSEHVARARQQLHDFVQDLLAEAKQAGDVRDDIAPSELASYCLHAVTAATSLQNPDEVHRLVRLVMSALTLAAK